MMKYTFALFLFTLYNTFAQSPFPKGYFIMPINPGQVSSLSGCFGDIRINHFHSGLDVRTGGQEGKRVVAAADGYVSRIRVQNGGYGNVMYITHPNGYTTVYAHLRDFNPELGQYLIQKQYEGKTWEIDLPLEPGKFEYKQGDVVAYSGNTGGSAGPHLHFEIRDEKENALDPQQFGFKEIRDIAAPVIEMVSLKCMSADARINGKFGILDFKPVRKGNGWTLPQGIKATGTIGVEVLTYDRSGNAPFRQGVHTIDLQMNKELQYRFRLDKMAFHNKLDMNIHVNYERLIQKNQKIHKCYVEEANSFDFYESNDHWGLLKIDNPQNEVKLTVSDAHGNATRLDFNISREDQAPGVPESETVSVFHRFLKINTAPVKLLLYGGKEVLLEGNGSLPLVYDLKEGFPEKILLGEKSLALPVNTAITLQSPKINKGALKADFTGTLYDDAYIFTEVNDEVLLLHDDTIPLKGEAQVAWTKTNAFNYPEKLKVYLEGSKRKFIGGVWKDKTIHFKTREFGTYRTLYDFDPPSITPRTVTAQQLRFTVADKLSGIAKIECYLNGEWILMDYEYKTGAIWARKKEEGQTFSGNLILKITDQCNNTQSYETTIP